MYFSQLYHAPLTQYPEPVCLLLSFHASMLYEKDVAK